MEMIIMFSIICIAVRIFIRIVNKEFFLLDNVVFCSTVFITLSSILTISTGQINFFNPIFIGGLFLVNFIVAYKKGILH
ncbi:hypothetical protein [Cetobacterium sp.]|uniref:hypothetical protein n=1 Tax=Cetobacterium sp. TaxID=2071632 RepID=UPI003F310D63